MNVEEQGSTENAKRQAEKAQKRSRKPSKFRRLSISRGRASFSKEKRSSEELQHLLAAEESSTGPDVEEEQIESRKVGVPTIDEIELKNVPVYVICPNCGEKGVTKTKIERSKEAECASLCLCLLQCYCCCWIPLVMNRLKQITHTCPHCMKQIGIYKQYNFLSRFTKPAEST